MTGGWWEFRAGFSWKQALKQSGVCQRPPVCTPGSRTGRALVETVTALASPGDVLEKGLTLEGTALPLRQFMKGPRLRLRALGTAGSPGSTRRPRRS